MSGPPLRTRRALAFDVIFGVVAPILCLLFDPVVFRADPVFGAPLFGRFRLAAYAFIALEILLLIAWLAVRPHGSTAALLFAGAFGTGTLFSAGLGLLLLPISLAAAIAGIGLLGLVPFLTAFVYARNALRALRHPDLHQAARITLLFCLGGFAVVVPPAGVHLGARMFIRRTEFLLRSPDVTERTTAMQTVERFSWLFDPDSIVEAWRTEPDPDLRDRMQRVYRRRTGGRIEQPID